VNSGTSHRFLLALALLAVLLLGGAVYWHMSQAAPTPAKRSAEDKVPVVVATVARHDIPIYLSGLGLVQASITVAVHSQVDGKLIDVPFTEGQHVRKGDVLARIDPSLYQAALDQALAKKAQDEAQLWTAVQDLERAKVLELREVDTAQLLDQLQGKVDQLKAMIAGDEAQIAAARTLLGRTVIAAPSDGRLGMRLIDPGNIVYASEKAAIVMLTALQPAAVVFSLPAKHLDEVLGALARGDVAVTALDQDNQRKLSTGRLLLIDNLIEQATATIRLKAMFANEDEQLWPGESVNARVLLDTRRGVLAVAPDAVQRGPQGLFAWVVTARDAVEMRPITVGATTERFTIVASGLSDGDRVVISGQLKLRPNAPVTVTSGETPVAGKP
jgi:membrane fusion protein, multidrug efflux system